MGLSKSKPEVVEEKKSMKEMSKEFVKNIRKLQRDFNRETFKLQSNNKMITKQIE